MQIDLRFASPAQGNLEVVVAPVLRFADVGYNAGEWSGSHAFGFKFLGTRHGAHDWQCPAACLAVAADRATAVVL